MNAERRMEKKRSRKKKMEAEDSPGTDSSENENRLRRSCRSPLPNQVKMEVGKRKCA